MYSLTLKETKNVKHYSFWMKVTSIAQRVKNAKSLLKLDCGHILRWGFRGQDAMFAKPHPICIGENAVLNLSHTK